MVIKLRDQGLLQHEPYQGIRLTEAGRREALKQLRRHRIVEAFLTEVMGFGWHQVHEEADRIAPTLDEMVVERMAAMANNPTHCPHGEPIPTPDGELPELHDVLIPDAPQNVELEITRVRTREPDRLEYMAALELTPGTRLLIVHAAPFNGPIQLRLHEKEFRIIGHNLAEMIRVQPVE
jgi:DtxR family Mn-dependent transcriptional regulator